MIVLKYFGVLAVVVFCATVAAQAPLPDVVPNDNRVPGGRLVDGVVELRLIAQWAHWTADPRIGPIRVQAFSEAGGAPRVPAPLLRVPEGTEVRVTVENQISDSTLIVRGLRAGAAETDSLHVAPGRTRELRFRAGAPGTYLYWGTTTGMKTTDDHVLRSGHYDGQLRGAIVVDPAGVAPDPEERVFVMTVLDILPDTTKPPPVPDYWVRAINGLSWPHTERLEYEVGRPVRWRWVNGTYLPHPMHLHGFHFRVLAIGDGTSDTPAEPGAVREVVTQHMASGTTFAMEWTPTRVGNWLIHCHMLPHITPFPERTAEERGHDAHDVTTHAEQGMGGLVMGIRTVAGAAAAAPLPGVPAHHLRIVSLQEPPAEPPAPRRRGYVLGNGTVAPDSMAVPGPTLFLTRGETTAITVVNGGQDPTSVHWHGMELESIYDGVAGWSGAGGNMAPLIAPGDSFTVAFTPPRSGTFMYHSHMDEAGELGAGSYGALLVLEPGQRHDPETDLLFMVGNTFVGGRNEATINGRREPPALTLRAGTTYRVRLASIVPADPLRVDLRADSTALTWQALAKDGADLPPVLRVDVPAELWVGTGETFDFLWTPEHPTEAVLAFRPPFGEEPLQQRLIVR